jgi:hypothetical protein
MFVWPTSWDMALGLSPLPSNTTSSVAPGLDVLLRHEASFNIQSSSLPAQVNVQPLGKAYLSFAAACAAKLLSSHGAQDIAKVMGY